MAIIGRDVRLLHALSAELVNFAAKVTDKTYPTASAMLSYVKDDIRSESKSVLP
jgi:hypothetical protein